MSKILTDGNDHYTAAPGEWEIYGLSGNDVIFTTQSTPDLYGGNHNDFLGNQGSGNMFGYGGEGNDTIHGGTEADLIYGGNGNDLLVGGEFNYLLSHSGSIVPFASFPFPFPAEASGNDYLDGGRFGDSLWGFDGNDVLLGGDGNDSNTNLIDVKDEQAGNTFINVAGGLYGGSGDDFLDGGRGNDFLDGGAGEDILIGGTGNDFLYGGNDGDLIITSAPTTAIDGFSVALGGNGNDTIQALGHDYVLGGFGNDALIASGEHAVSFYGEGDNDTLVGSRAADILDGGAGIDGLIGGFGNDIYIGGADGDHFVMNNDIRAGDIETITDFAGDFIAMPTAYEGHVGVIDTVNGVFVYVPLGNSLWGALVTNTHDVTAVQASIYYAG